MSYVVRKITWCCKKVRQDILAAGRIRDNCNFFGIAFCLIDQVVRDSPRVGTYEIGPPTHPAVKLKYPVAASAGVGNTQIGQIVDHHARPALGNMRIVLTRADEDIRKSFPREASGAIDNPLSFSGSTLDPSQHVSVLKGKFDDAKLGISMSFVDLPVPESPEDTHDGVKTDHRSQLIEGRRELLHPNRPAI